LPEGLISAVLKGVVGKLFKKIWGGSPHKGGERFAFFWNTLWLCGLWGRYLGSTEGHHKERFL